MKASAVLVVVTVADVMVMVMVVVTMMIRIAGGFSFPLAGRYFHGRLPTKGKQQE
mgnify:CR=1 FL=1